LFWNSTSQTPVKFINTLYATLVEYQAVSGQDLHSLQADPTFADPSNGDFNLLEGSLAIDAGTSAQPEWPAVDAIGDGRVDQAAIPDRGAGPVTYTDIGALEVVQQLQPDVIILPNPFNTISDRGRRHAGRFQGGAAADSLVALSGGIPNPFHHEVE